jgi:hypothetical protein
MLDELGTDSAPDEGKLNLNYANAVVTYTNLNGVQVPINIAIIAGMETNLVPWTPQNFFLAAGDRLIRYYSASWFTTNQLSYQYQSFTNTFAVTNAFSITNIPVWVSNRFVYTPAVNRLLQLAANLYDATTSTNNNLPHVFRPIFERVNSAGDIFIVGYTNVASVIGPTDPQLAPPHPVTDLLTYNKPGRSSEPMVIR